MRIVDWKPKPRRRFIMEAIHDEYIPVDNLPLPDGDYLFVDGSYWYKEKANTSDLNKFGGKIVLIDYAREMVRKRRNKGRIRADFLAIAENESKNSIPILPWSMPELDTYSMFGINGYINKGSVLITSRDDSGGDIVDVVRYCRKKSYRIIWKLRNKFGHLADSIKKCLSEKDIFLWTKEKDYNDAIPILARYAPLTHMHINLNRISFCNIEMARAEIVTHVWENGGLHRPDRIRNAQAFFDEKPPDFCTRNLIRQLREDLNSH